MGSYASELDYLFNFTNKDATKPYSVDSYLYNYTTDAATFNSTLPMSGGANINSYYYVGISSVNLSYESADSVDAISGPLSFDANSTKRQFFNPTNQTAQSASEPAICKKFQDSSSDKSTTPTIAQSTSDFDGDIERNDIFVTINPSADSVKINTIKMSVVKMIRDRSVTYTDLYNRLKTPPTNNNSTKSNISHTEFDNYLNDINKSIASVYLKEVYRQILESQRESSIPGDASQLPDNIYEADRIRLTGIGNLKVINIAWKFEPLMADLRAASKKTLYTIMNKTPNLNARTLVQGFANRYSMSSGASKGYYYLYRTLMYDFFKIDKKLVFEEDGSVDLFSKKLLVDMFIKCCYPLIHYDLIDILMVRYTEKGDFVNARFALLAKCLFSFNIVNELVTSMADADVDASIKTQFSSNLTAYIQRNNKGDINSDKSTQEKIKEIVIDLHNMSNKVVSNSDHMELLKSSIKENQLSMRNVSAAIEERKGGVSKKYVEYYILIAIMILLITACGVVYFLEFYDIGLIVAASTVVSILAYKLILLIISLIMKN